MPGRSGHLAPICSDPPQPWCSHSSGAQILATCCQLPSGSAGETKARRHHGPQLPIPLAHGPSLDKFLPLMTHGALRAKGCRGHPRHVRSGKQARELTQCSVVPRPRRPWTPPWVKVPLPRASQGLVLPRLQAADRMASTSMSHDTAPSWRAASCPQPAGPSQSPPPFSPLPSDHAPKQVSPRSPKPW